MAGMMLELQAKGVHAIGFVSPTHFVPQIVRALSIAIPQGPGIARSSTIPMPTTQSKY